jgi:hypothetical protein
MTLLNFSPCSTYYLSTFFTYERLTSSSTYLYQKDERALPGIFIAVNLSVPPPPPLKIVSLTTLPHILFSLFLSHSTHSSKIHCFPITALRLVRRNRLTEYVTWSCAVLSVWEMGNVHWNWVLRVGFFLRIVEESKSQAKLAIISS